MMGIVRARLAGVVLMLALGGCESMYRATPTSDEERAEQNAAERFLSPEKQRAWTFDPASDTLLDTPSRPIDGPRIRETDPRIQPRSFEQRPPVAFRFGSGGRPDTAAILDQDAAQISVVDADGDGSPETRRVSLSFNNDPLDFVLQQILNGILRQNYLLSADGSTPITFRTERPLPVSELLPLLRGIVAREGLELRRIEGVYHVGPPEVVAAIAEARGADAAGGTTLGVLPVGEGLAEDVASILTSVAGEGAVVIGVPQADRVVVRALPEEIAAMRRLVSTMFGNSLGNRVAAILPVRAATPSQIVSEIRQILEEGEEGQTSGVTLVPLPTQQAILIGARSERRLRDIRRLVNELDNDIRERPQVRVIALSYLDATATAAQLTEVITGVVIAPTEVISEGSVIPASDSRILRARDIRAAAGTNAGPADVAAIEAENEVAAGEIAADGGVPPGAEARALSEAEFFADALEESVVTIVPDPRNNALLVRSSYDDYLQIRETVIALDVPQPQLVLEGTILEVTLNDALEFGVQSFLNENGITARISETVAGLADPGGTGLAALGSFGAFTGVNIDVLVTALQSVTDVQVISSPYLSVVNGESASLVVGDEIPFLTASQSSSDTGDVTVTNEIETVQTGITVNIQPRIRPDDTVRMNIQTEVSSVVADATTIADELTPTIARRQLDSVVTVRSGGTVMLGGLIQAELALLEGGVPVLRNIPILGNLFGVTNSDLRRSELLILLTPRVNRTAFEIERITETIRGEVSIR